MSELIAQLSSTGCVWMLKKTHSNGYEAYADTAFHVSEVHFSFFGKGASLEEAIMKLLDAILINRKRRTARTKKLKDH